MQVNQYKLASNQRPFRLAVLLTLLAICIELLVRSRSGDTPDGSSGAWFGGDRSIVIRSNLRYPTRSRRDGFFDLYAPANYLEVRHPVLIWLHGGGWRIGDKSDWLSANLARHAAKLGFVVLNVNYRLNTPQHPVPYPGAVEDVADFNRFLRDHLDLANAADGVHVSIGGHSAGGHLALYEATDPDAPFRYACVIDVAGVVDLESDGLPVALEPYVIAFAPDVEARRLASPLHRLANWRAEHVLLVHALDDPSVPVAQSKALAYALSKLRPTLDLEQVYPKHGEHDLESIITNDALDRFLMQRCG